MHPVACLSARMLFIFHIISSMTKTAKILQRPIQTEVYQAALGLGLSEIQARLVAQRLNHVDKLEAIIQPQLKHLQHPRDLKNSEQAAELIADAIQSDGLIVLSTDYDVDGVTSAWVAYHALIDYFGVPEERIVCIISQRKDGYGMNDEVCNQILSLDQKVDLVISADQGSSDEPRIARLAQAGIRVCITDHHQIPDDGPPKSATCVVNPQQDGCEYDKTIAGCFVIFLVMTQVRQALIQRGYLPQSSPSLKDLAMHVALGTVADSVSLQSPNNRAIVLAGLGLINRFQHPAWQAMRKLNNNQNRPYNAEFLGFQVATRINAASRVSDVSTAFHFLNAATPEQAFRLLQQLEADNEERKAQQHTMLEQAMEKAKAIVHDGKYSLALDLQGNAGIQGIIATRVGEKFGLPCVALTYLDDGSMAGSGRGIVPELDLSLAFQWMEQQQPDLFLSRGGHKGAAGCQIPAQYFSRFSELMEQAVKNQLGDQPPTPIIETDGELNNQWFTPAIVQEIEQLEPFGREWPQPQFHGRFQIQDLKVIGQTQTHLSFKLMHEQGGLPINAVYFGALEQAPETADQIPFSRKDWVECVFQTSLNHFMGKTSLQLRVQYMQKI